MIIDIVKESNRSSMKERTFEDARNTIKSLDERTLDERATRLKELGVITLSAIARPLPQRMDDYMSEAGKTFIEGCFRSCIFCCAAAVDQTFRHEIILDSENPSEEHKKLRDEHFYKIIKLAEDKERLRLFCNDAHWLRRLRNTVAVHPLCLWPRSEDEKLRNEIIVQDLNEIISVVDAEDREKIKQLYIIKEDGTRVVLADVLRDPSTPNAWYLLMWRPDNDILKPLALKAYQRMTRILEKLYPSAI